MRLRAHSKNDAGDNTHGTFWEDTAVTVDVNRTDMGGFKIVNDFYYERFTNWYTQMPIIFYHIV